MKKSFSFVAAIITLALAAGAATSAGCGGVSTASLCGDICACQRCTSNDLETCEVEGDKASDDAAAAGCASQFDDFVSCASEHVSCKGDRADFDGCEAAQTALSACSKTINVLGKDACERATDLLAAKYTGCGGEVGNITTTGGGMAQCTDAAAAQLTCISACYVAADCSLLVANPSVPPTNEQVKQYTDCVQPCQL